MKNFVDRIAEEHNIDTENIKHFSEELSTFLLNKSDFTDTQLVELIRIITTKTKEVQNNE